jgi:hypothetical protein
MTDQLSTQVAALVGPAVQIAHVVVDLDDAVERWRREGAGPFVIRRHIPVTDVDYRGSPSTFDHSSAYGQWGDVMVELVVDHGTERSAVRERFPVGVEGVHHHAHFVESLNETLKSLAALGFEVAMSAWAGTVRFVFVDTFDVLGHYLELYEPTDHLRGFYRHVAELAVQ